MLNHFLFRGHLEEGEQVSMVLHRHWVSGIACLFWPTVALLVGLALAYVSVARVNLLLGVLLGCLVILVWWLRNFCDYYLDAWIITDQGIIDIEWHGLFHRESSRVLYSDLQGVSYEVHGILPTLLRYGTISVEKISTGSEISMEQAPYPRTVEALILKNMEAYLHSKNMKNATHVQDMLAEIIAERFQMESASNDADV